MVKAAQNDKSVNETGSWGGPRVKTWDTKGKREVMMLKPSVFAFVDMVAKSTKRTKRSLVVQIFMEGLHSVFGVTARDLDDNEYGCASSTARAPLATTKQLREWAKTLTSVPFEEDAQENEA